MKVHFLRAVRPDWAIQKRSWQQPIFIKLPEYFGDILKNDTFKVKITKATLGATFGKNWANFYFNIWMHCLRVT